ncbi:hypothetical protein DBR42_06075 [Pelomonas sp. HMWF004]|nr:hypothetical protein DBR42_06075 [Pelomonas sp. HMWF004]
MCAPSRRRLAAVIAFVVAAALAPLPAVAAAACERKFTVGVAELGWGLYRERGELRGVVPDLLAELARRSGCTFVMEVRPRARLVADYQAGAVDIITSSYRTPERDGAGQFMPYAYTEMDLVLADTVPKAVDSAERLAAEPSLVLGSVRGNYGGEIVAEVFNRLTAAGRLELASDFENLTTRLEAGRFSAGAYPAIIHSKFFSDGRLRGFRVVRFGQTQPDPIGLYVNHSRVTPADREHIAAALQAVVKADGVRKIYRRYLTAEEVRRLFRLDAQGAAAR